MAPTTPLVGEHVSLENPGIRETSGQGHEKAEFKNPPHENINTGDCSATDGDWYNPPAEDNNHVTADVFVATDGEITNSVLAIINYPKTMLKTYEYDSYGNIVKETGYIPFENAITYTGRVWLPEIKMYDYRARYYDPRAARFISEDPIWQTNLYMYVNNNPLLLIDPRGEDDRYRSGTVDFEFTTPLTSETMRPLTPQEKLKLLSIFGSHLDVNKIFFHTNNIYLDQSTYIGREINGGRPFTLGNHVYIQGDSLPDYTLVHEATHVWQSQNDYKGRQVTYGIGEQVDNFLYSHCGIELLNPYNFKQYQKVGAPFFTWPLEAQAAYMEEEFLNKGFNAKLPKTAYISNYRWPKTLLEKQKNEK